MEAQQKLDTNGPEVQGIRDHLPAVSAASKSVARTDLTFADGSMLVGESREGGEVEFRVIDPETAALSENPATEPPSKV